jgi:putative acetyltransferase
MKIRPEHAGDADAIFALHAAAFPTHAECRLVDRLRSAGKARLSLVAEDDAGRIVGHVLFSPVDLLDPDENIVLTGLGLAPVAVLPEFQRRGIAAQLIDQGLAISSVEGAAFVVVLGEPEYYGRFGFIPASRFGIRNEYGVDAAFRIVAHQPHLLPAAGGLAKYAAEFAELAQ